MNDFISSMEARKQLSWCEAKILSKNITHKSTHGSFIALLAQLLENTQDQVLCKEMKSLISKIKALTPREFEKLKQDVLQGHTAFPLDYTIKNI